MPKMNGIIIVDWNDTESIRKAEKKKKKLENAGWYLKDTKQVGLNKFKLIYKRATTVKGIYNELMRTSKSFRESTPRTRETRVKRIHTLRN